MRLFFSSIIYIQLFTTIARNEQFSTIVTTSAISVIPFVLFSFISLLSFSFARKKDRLYFYSLSFFILLIKAFAPSFISLKLLVCVCVCVYSPNGSSLYHLLVLLCFLFFPSFFILYLIPYLMYLHNFKHLVILNVLFCRY